MVVANVGGYLEQVKEISLDLGTVVTDFKRDMALTSEGRTVAVGRKALCWKVLMLHVCTHLSSAKAGLERAL